MEGRNNREENPAFDYPSHGRKPPHRGGGLEISAEAGGPVEARSMSERMDRSQESTDE